MRFLGLEIQSRYEERSVVRVGRRSEGGDPFYEGYWTTPETYLSGGASTALRSSAVYSCIRLIAETVASLPLILYERLPDGGKQRAVDHPLYWTLAAEPNRRSTRMEFFETVCWHLLLRGNAYARLRWSGERVELDLLHPDCMTVEPRDDGTLYYTYRFKNKVINYTQYDLIHIRGHSEDGIKGRSPIDVAREAIYRSVSMEEYQTNTYRNGTKLSGVLEAKHELSDEVASRIIDSFRKMYSGSSNAGKVALIEDDTTYKPISMTLEQAEFVDSLKHNRSLIAGIFGVPPHMIGDLDRATFSNIEQQQLAFLMYTIRTWLVRIEQALMRGLFMDENERRKYVIEFLSDAILRGDFKSRMEGYKIALETGMAKFNEVRERENWNPLEWGDATMVPLNMKVIRSSEDLENEPANSNDDNPEPAGADNDQEATEDENNDRA